jgi:dTMP kinase
VSDEDRYFTRRNGDGGLVKNAGAFIVLEGLDGAGISTQAVRLENHLKKRGYKTMLTKEPTMGLIGGLIQSALEGNWRVSHTSLQLLFSADRAQHIADEIEPALKQGKIVICDRYVFSTLAYGFASGINFEWLYAINKTFKAPDLTLFIDVSPDVSVSRISKGRERRELFEKRETLSKVRKAYLNLARRFRFKIINGEEGIEGTGDEIAKATDYFLGLKAKHK